MASKPTDYFLGLHDFFALLLPGILVGWAWLRVNSPESTAEIERLAAYSKLYRSLAVVLLVFAFFGFPGSGGNATLDWQWHWKWGATTLSASVSSFGAYVFYRIRHRKAIVLFLQLARPNQ